MLVLDNLCPNWISQFATLARENAWKGKEEAVLTNFFFGRLPVLGIQARETATDLFAVATRHFTYVGATEDFNGCLAVSFLLNRGVLPQLIKSRLGRQIHKPTKRLRILLVVWDIDKVMVRMSSMKILHGAIKGDRTPAFTTGQACKNSQTGTCELSYVKLESEDGGIFVKDPARLRLQLELAILHRWKVGGCAIGVEDGCMRVHMRARDGSGKGALDDSTEVLAIMPCE